MLRSWTYTAVLLAAHLLSWPAMIQAWKHYPVPENTFNETQDMQRPAFAFVVLSAVGEVRDGVRQFSPLYFRRRGGIGDMTPMSQEYLRSDEHWGYQSNTHLGHGPWVLLYRNLEGAVHGLDAPENGYIIYAVATSLNMVPREAEQTARNATLGALGGVQWSQIRAWAYLSYDQWEHPDSLQWQPNREFDDRWRQLGASGPQPALSGSPRIPGTTRLNVAWNFMNLITNRTDERSALFSTLVDWDITNDRHRDFPLLRGGLRDDEGQPPVPLALPAAPAWIRQPDSLQMNILRQFDWNNVDVPEFIRRAMLATAVLTPMLCRAAIKSLRDSYQKRSSLPQSYDIFFNEAPAAAVVVDDGMSCEQLVKIVNKHCHSITALRVNFRIAHGIKDGTWSSVGLLLGGHGGVDGLIPLAKEARPGFQVDNLDVDLKLVFESDVVPLRDIQLIRLLDIPGNRYYGPDSWVFGGITLTATCADFPEKMEMLKYATVNKEMKRETGRFDMETVWEGDVELKDWNRQP